MVKSVEMEKNTSGVLDALRFLAAHIVVLGHAISFAGLGFGQYPSTPNMQSTSVLVFLFVSGYTIAYVCFESSRHDFSDFVLNRAVRLLVPLIPCLILQGFFEWYFGDLLPYREAFTVWAFFSNLSFLTVAPFHMPPFGVNRPLWSLSVEWWLYIFYGFLYFYNYELKNRFLVSLAMVSVVVFATAFYYEKQMSLIICWFFGVFSFYACKNQRKNQYSLFCTVGLIAILYSGISLPVDGNYSIAYSFFCSLILSLVVIFVRLPSAVIFLCKINSKYSYTLYLVHYPVLCYVFYVVRVYQGVNFVLASYLLSLGVAFLLYYFFERNYKKIRKAIKLFLGKKCVT